ncbi:Hsp20/alpha crystallin family protein [Aciduricibacillus chroicocephali]|uniref:Hsp20/alpha crystallin family protein n=1 Tax=Aciduricibacillus chroicocephali TaxID=3054939 RepID=A0ABY9KXZ2_9BACI|nr:Hsp20/alpha crystallin family protein [Bacillaceae bacterium 44XB]
MSNENRRERGRMDFQPLHNVMKQIDSFFHQSRNRFKTVVNAHEIPATVKETERGYEITAQLAGYSREQIRMQVIGNQLHITALKNNTSTSDDNKLKKVITLPFLISEKDVRASHKDGLLKVLIPKKKIGKDQFEME